MGSENAHGCAQHAENGFGFDFLDRYHKIGDEILIHIVRVTDDETWVSFVNAETKESQSSGCTHIHQTSRKSLKQTSARKLMATVFWDKSGVPTVELMQQGATVTSELYCESLKNCVGPFRTKGV
jgi:hypothetical protein